METLKQIALCIYAIALTAGVLYLGYILQPIVVAHPKTASLVSLGIMILSLPIAILLLFPQKLLSTLLKTLPLIAYYIYALGVICAFVVPWLRGVSGFGTWEWIAVIMYMWGLSAILFQICQETYRCFGKTK